MPPPEKSEVLGRFSHAATSVPRPRARLRVHRMIVPPAKQRFTLTFCVFSSTRGPRRAPGDSGRRRRRLALPHHLQLRGSLPARHQHHPRHRRSEKGTAVPQILTTPSPVRQATDTLSQRERVGSNSLQLVMHAMRFPLRCGREWGPRRRASSLHLVHRQILLDARAESTYHWYMTAHKIKTIRKRLGLSQDEFARRLGVARVTVTRWENGSRRPGSITARAIRSTLSPQEAQGWHSVSRAALNEIWDNPEDAIYDHWRAHFGAKAR